MWRNKEMHDDNYHRPNNPMQQVLRITKDYFILEIVNGHVLVRNKVLHEVSWKPPTEAMVKLNTNGASKEGKIVGCGGIIRGSDRQWLRGFTKSIGNCNAFVAELWGVFKV
jgi:hypothetical protein